MMKYLVLAAILFTPLSAHALSAEQEFVQKCDIKLKQRTQYVKEKTVYDDSRICTCMAEESKKSVGEAQFQDVADFYTEKYEGMIKNSSKLNVAPAAMQICMTKLFSKEEVAAANVKIREGFKKSSEEQAAKQKKMNAERDKKIAADQAKFKAEMQALSARKAEEAKAKAAADKAFAEKAAAEHAAEKAAAAKQAKPQTPNKQ